MGSKRVIAKDIIKIIKQFSGDKKDFVDLFCGGCNVVAAWRGDGQKIANDVNPYVIALYDELVYGRIELPDEITVKQYKAIKTNKEKYPKALVGFVGVCCSFGGEWFEGYARSHKENRDYVGEGKRNIASHKKDLVGVRFLSKDYREVGLPAGAIVYCDPPYQNTRGYRQAFNHNDFWEYVRKISITNDVYVSELKAPSDFMAIWSKKHIHGNMSADNRTVVVERLWVYEKSPLYQKIMDNRL